MGTIQEYTDPLLDLLHSQLLNQDEALSNELVEYIDSISDIELKKWCIDSLTILRNLEKIETTLNGWEFQALNFREAGVFDGEDEVSNKLAKRVLKRLNSVRQELIDEKSEINTSVQRARKVGKDVNLVITDAGTILVELTMRIVKLAKGLDQEVTIRYSRAKLTLIGYELNKLAMENMVMDKDVVRNYRTFVGNLLAQLNSAVDNKDTVGLWESVAIIGDVEKMFNSMKEKNRKMGGANMNPSSYADSEMPQSIPPQQKHVLKPKLNSTQSTFSSAKSSASTSAFSSSAPSPSTLNTERAAETTVSVISAKEVFNNDKGLLRTKISDHMPLLMNAFKKEEPNEDFQGNNAVIRSENDEKGDSNTTIEKKPEITFQQQPSPTQIPPPTLPSVFGPSILNAFYRPNVKDPIYINKDDSSETDIDEGCASSSILPVSKIDPSKSHILQQLSLKMRQKKIEE